MRKHARGGGASTGGTSLDDCLRSYFAIEHLAGEDAYHCERCAALRPAQKSLRLLHCPNLLAVHLKRFRMEMDGRAHKRPEHVSFPLEGLDLGEWCVRDPSDPPPGLSPTPPSSSQPSPSLAAPSLAAPSLAAQSPPALSQQPALLADCRHLSGIACGVLTKCKREQIRIDR